MNASLRKVGALCSKDFADLFRNPTMSVVCLMPVAFMLLFRFMIGDTMADSGLAADRLALADREIMKYLLGSALCMTTGMVGSMTVLYGIAEEKEKRTLRTLMLANVSAGQVAAAKSVLALAMIGVVDAACFLVCGGEPAWFGPYLVLGLVGSLPVVLVSLVLGLACRDQMTAGFYSVPVLLLAMVPMFGMSSEAVASAGRFTPLGGVYELMGMVVDGTAGPADAVLPLAVTLAWIAIGAVLFASLFRRLARDN